MLAPSQFLWRARPPAFARGLLADGRGSDDSLWPRGATEAAAQEKRGCSGAGGGGKMSGEDEQQEQTIAADLVVTGCKMGGDIANRVLRSLVEAACSGVSVLSLCEKGDAVIMEETGKIFKKEKEMKKGVAFPTSISVNNCVCHFSPLKSDQDYVPKEGDLVKTDQVRPRGRLHR